MNGPPSLQSTQNRIRVLRIIARLNIGGPAIHATLLTAGLDPQRFDSTLLTGRVPSEEGDMTYMADAYGIRPLVVEELGREISLEDDWRALTKIYRVISRWRPNIIHTHTAKAGTLGRLAGIIYNAVQRLRALSGRSSEGGAALVHTFHGHIFHSYFSPGKSRLFLAIERGLGRFTDRIIAISDRQYRELCHSYRVAPAHKISVVPLGFDLSPFLSAGAPREIWRRRWGVEEDCVLVGMIGRLVPVKNHAMLLRVAQRFAASGPAAVDRACPRVRFLIVGDGELRASLAQQARALGVADLVVFAGWEKNIHLVYAALDVVALTSFNEGTPVALIEAAASAKPVVSTDVGGVRDVVEEGRSGYLTPVGDVDLFYQRLSELVCDADKRRAFGEYGRGLVLDRHSKDALLRNVEAIYEQVWQRRRGYATADAAAPPGEKNPRG